MKYIAVVTLLLSSLLSACGDFLPEPHKIDVQQGNAIKAETLDQLKIGMTEKQVIYLLGTPMIRDMFHKDRWDYVYTLKQGDGPMARKKLTLLFKDGNLVKIDNNSYAGSDSAH